MKYSSLCNYCNSYDYVCSNNRPFLTLSSQFSSSTTNFYPFPTTWRMKRKSVMRENRFVSLSKLWFNVWLTHDSDISDPTAYELWNPNFKWSWLAIQWALSWTRFWHNKCQNTISISFSHDRSKPRFVLTASAFGFGLDNISFHIHCELLSLLAVVIIFSTIITIIEY